MTTQEILASLSQLEQELQSIKSARALAEDTVGAYAEVKIDIKNLLNEFESVTKSLSSISSAFESENEILTTEIQNSINVVKGQLETLNTAFANQCNSVIVRFTESVNKAAGDLATKTESLSGNYERNNADFKSSIKELASVHSSLIKATESVTSLKVDIATLQGQLNQSQKNQDATLEKIASQLQATGTSHTQILTQIANDLKSSQDAQDAELADIKSAQGEQNSKLDAVSRQVGDIANNLGKILTKISDVSSLIGKRADSIESKIGEASEAVKSNKTMIIINIVISVIAVLVALFK